MANELAPDICPHGIGPGACDSREQCSLRWSRGDRGTLIESVQRSPEAKCTPASDWGCEARRKLGVARGALQAIADGEGADEQAFDWSEFHDSIKRQAREAFDATARPAKCPETPKRTRAPEARPWPSGWVVTGSSEGHYRWRAIGPWRESRSEAESDVVRTETATADETERLRTALGKLNEIRNSIIGIQGFNFSEHAYPMVAALDMAPEVASDSHRDPSSKLDSPTVARAVSSPDWPPGRSPVSTAAVGVVLRFPEWRTTSGRSESHSANAPQ